MRAALLNEVSIEYKFEEIKATILPGSLKELTPQCVDELMDKLSI